MGGKRQRIAGLLKRFQFIDLARAVSTGRDVRKGWLREYVDREGVFSSYEPFRKCVGGLYNVQLGLDTSAPREWDDLRDAVRRHCRGKDEDMNLDAAKALHGLLGQDTFIAYPARERSLRIGPDRTVAFRIEHYLVRGDVAVFQFPYPRRTRLSPRNLTLMMSLIHHAYVTGDFAEARVEIADLSCVPLGRGQHGPRQPHRVALAPDNLIGLDELNAEIQNVYDILMELSEE